MTLNKLNLVIRRYAALAFALAVIGFSARSAFAAGGVNCSADSAEGCESIPARYCGTLQGNFNYVMRQPYGCNGATYTGSGTCFPSETGPCCVNIRTMACPTSLPCPCPASQLPTEPPISTGD